MYEELVEHLKSASIHCKYCSDRHICKDESYVCISKSQIKAAEAIEKLELKNDELENKLKDSFAGHLLDVLNRKEEELEQVKAERDAAVEDLKSQYDIQGIEDDHPIYDMSICFKCIYYPSSFNRYCEDCNNFDKWQWRGVQGGKGND